MQKDKHSIYSKEQLLKIIKEGKNAPADMDEFELEALEGLKLLGNPSVLNELDKEVDEIVIAEKKKESQRKTIYYFSTAASLLLLIGLIFLFKNEVLVKNEKVVASVEKPKEENVLQESTPPVQEDAPATYESKEPEQAKTPKQEMIVLSENGVKQKQNEGEVSQDRSVLKEERNLEQTVAANAKSADGNLAWDKDVERKEQEVAANQSFGARGEAKSDNVSEQQDQLRAKDAEKSKKVSASMTQPAMAYQSKDQQQIVSSSPSAPRVESKNAEEKAKADVYSLNKSSDIKGTKTYKEASFINGDSAFAAYVKQNLKISSPNNSGIIVVEFLVDNNGTSSNIEILKSLADCEICSKDVIDFIRSIKKWKPAIENGKAINAPKKISLQYN